MGQGIVAPGSDTWNQYNNPNAQMPWWPQPQPQPQPRPQPQAAPGVTGYTTPKPELYGLLPQNVDAFGTYGQMGVAQPWLQHLTQRFGWDPSGVAFGRSLTPGQSWYRPRILLPKSAPVDFSV